MANLQNTHIATQIFGSAHTGLLLLRVGIGVGLAWLHGWGKLNGAFGYFFGGSEWKFIAGVEGIGFPLPAFFALAVALAETLGAVLVAAGLLTRPAALLAAFTMLVAIYRHLSQGQGAELAAFYLIAYGAIALIGPGAYSVDAKLAQASTQEHASRGAAAWLLGRS